MENKEISSPEIRRLRLWVLASRHSGDNTQLMALANALGWPFEVKRLAYRRHEELLRLFSLATLAAVDPAQSSPLAPPWPDLVLCAGRSTEAVAMWIRKHANPSVRIVFVGTPWTSPRHFDLVITTPQYGLPRAPNILHLALPVHSVTAEAMACEAARWEPRLEHLPRPRIAVLVGGGSGPYVFRPAAATRLGREASRLGAARGGALLITTSSRTPKASTDALEAAVTVPSHMFRWTPEQAENPFLAFLGLADEIIVTADSISMLAEACATGKPVWLFDIEDGAQSMQAEESTPVSDGRMPPIHWLGKTLDATAFRFLMRLAPPRWSRDLRVIHRDAVAAGLAQWLGEEPRPRQSVPLDDLSRATARIRGLFAL